MDFPSFDAKGRGISTFTCDAIVVDTRSSLLSLVSCNLFFSLAKGSDV